MYKRKQTGKTKALSYKKDNAKVLTKSKVDLIKEEFEDAILELVENFYNQESNDEIVDRIEVLNSLLASGSRSSINIKDFSEILSNEDGRHPDITIDCTKSDEINDPDVRMNKKTLSSRAIKLVFMRQKVYMFYEDSRYEEIGITNFQEIESIDLLNHPSMYAEELIETVTSCLMPSVKSTSPSMILHQLTVMTLIRSMINCSCVVEPQGSYTPDLLLTFKDIDYLVDVTSDRTEIKLNHMLNRVSGKRLIVINKYRIMDYLPDCFDYLISQAHLNESDITPKIETLINTYSNYHDKQSVWSKEIFKFFRKGYDNRGTKIAEYENIATDWLYNKIHNKLDNRPLERILNLHVNELNVIYAELVNKLRSSIPASKRDSEAHIFPRIMEPDKRYDETQHVEIDLNLHPVTDLIDSDGCLRADFEISRSTNSDKVLYSKIDKVFAHYKSEAESRNYPFKKQKMNIKRAKEISLLLNTLESRPHLKEAISMRICSHTNLKYDPSKKVVNMPIGSKIKDFKIMPMEPYESELWTKYTDFYQYPHSLDPNHQIILSKFNVSRQIQYLLRRSRFYHDLRFKQRISKTISDNWKPNRPMRVNHWFNEDLHAEVLVSGLLFQKDSGVAIVSYFFYDKLYRTEKWRLVDLENFKINATRLIAMSVSIDKLNDVSYQLKGQMIYLISSILTEGPWGLSIFLKNFRYFSYNFTITSPKTNASMKKMFDCLYPGITNKISFRILTDILRCNPPIEKFQTPLFRLPIKYLSFEIFLVNCCPNKTYGKRKHLLNTMEDVFKEIDLYDSKFNIVKDIHDDFKNNVLNSDNLYHSIRAHMSKYELMIGELDQRFTLSPISIVMIKSEIDKIIIPYKKLQNSCDHITALMTGRASHDTIKFTPNIAASSIKSLIEKYKTNSTSNLALKILSSGRLPDLSMRMFDKDQIGGNREISILSAEYRVLQYITEAFYRVMCEQLDNEMLSKVNKDEIFIDKTIQAFKRPHRYFISIDQTRWGPNFTTSQWSYMSAMLLSKTTEAYIPTILCAIADFKIFEVPPWINELYPNIQTAQSVVGRVGRSHMGQGIFHATSSFYHALVTKKIQSILDTYIKFTVSHHRWVVLEHNSFVTSDDCTISESLHIITPSDNFRLRQQTNQNIDYEQLNHIAATMIDKIRLFYTAYSYIVPFFGIKTSLNKNSVSEEMVEFNSQYMAKDTIIKNDIKYLYSLIDPSTTGVMLHDYSNALNSYYCAINSGASLLTSEIIAMCNYHKFCLDWKIRLDYTSLPSDSSLVHGLPSINWISTDEKNQAYSIYNKSNLRFKTRDLFKNIQRNTNNPIYDMLIKIQLEVISSSREKSDHKAIRTHYKGKHRIMNDSSFIENHDLTSISFNYLIRSLNKNIYMLDEFLNNEYENTNSCVQYTKLVDKSSPIIKLILRISRSAGFNIWNYILAIKGTRPTLSDSSDEQDILLHLARKEWIGEIKDLGFLEDYKDLEVDALLHKLRDLMVEYHIKSSNVATYVNRSEIDIDSYYCVETQFMKNLDVIELSLNTEKMTTIFRIIPNLGCYHDFCGRLIYKRGELSIEPLRGIEPVIHGPKVDYNIIVPYYMDLLRYTDMRIRHIDRYFRTVHNIRDVYVIMSIDRQSYRDYVEPEDEDDEEEMFENDEDEYASLMNNVMQLVDNLSTYESKVDDLSLMRNPDEFVVSVKVPGDMFIYSDNYFRDRLLMNYMINKMIQDGVLIAEDYRPGYILEDIEKNKLKIHTIDPTIHLKLSKLDKKARAMMNYDAASIAQSWVELFETLNENLPLFSDDDIVHKIPLLFPCQYISVGIKPQGQIVEIPEFLAMFKRRTMSLRNRET